MTCTAELRARLLLPLAALAALAACGEAPADPPPMEQARSALAAGDGLGAEVALRSLLAEGVPQEDLAAYLGEAELQQGQLDEARRWLEPAAFSDATAGHGFHMLGRLEMRAGNLPLAGQAFDRAHGHIADSSDLWVDIARLRFSGGEQKQAIEASRRAVELDPDNPAALLLRAQLVRDSEGPAAALPWLEAGLKHAPDDLDLLGDYAATLGDAGRARDMLAAVRRMAEIDDRNPRLFYLQAVLAARGGDPMLARTLLSRAGPALSESPAGMLLGGAIDIGNGNYESAAQVLDRLARMQPDNARVRELLVHALAAGLNERELAHRFGEGEAGDRGRPYLDHTVGRSLEAADRREQAAPLLDRALRPVSADLLVLPTATPLEIAGRRREQGGQAVQALVRGSIQAGQAGAAVAEGERFRRRFPGSFDALVLAGDAQLAARRTQPALALYREAAGIRRPWPLAYKIALAQRELGDPGAARAGLEDFLRDNPASGEASAELARLAAAGGEWPLVAVLTDHAIDHGGAHDPGLWRLRARAAAASGEGELAFDAAVYAYALNPLSRESTGLLAGIARAQGDRRLAEGLGRKLARLGA